MHHKTFISQDYYPFGMLMPTRTWDAESSYRFGFQGQERDDEIKGSGNHLPFGDYGYDTRLGRRWQIDPEWKKIPAQSPYSCNNNNPSNYTDPDGRFGVIGALIGAGVGFLAEVGSQAVSNAMAGQPLFKSIDWADVAISTAERAIIGATEGAAIIATSTTAAGLRASIDHKDGQLNHVGNGKSGKDVVKDVISEGIGIGVGKIGLGDFFGEAAMKLSKGAFKKAGVLTGKAVDKLMALDHAVGKIVDDGLSAIGKGLNNSIFDKLFPNKGQIKEYKSGGGHVKISDIDINDGTIKEGGTIIIDEPLKEVEIVG